MQDVSKWQGGSYRYADAPESGGVLTFQDAKTILRRHGRVIGICVGLCVSLAIAYVWVATPQYTASTRILIDTPRGPVISTEAGAQATSGGLAVQEVESQIQVLQSDRIGIAVLEYLKSKSMQPGGAEERPSFLQRVVRAPSAIIRVVSSWIKGPAPEVDPDREALETLMDRITIRRLGTSYVLEISYTSPSPLLAAEISNAFARAYISEEVESRARVWRRASTWLEERVNELQKRSEEASRAAQDFKAQNSNNAETWPRARELERAAEAYDALYSAYLRRHTDSVQQESFPISNSKIISEAVRPLTPSQPRSFLLVLMGALTGSVIGLGLALLRWHADRTISTPAQVAAFGVRCLATLPRLPDAIAADPKNAVRTALRAPRSQFIEALRIAHAEISMSERHRRIKLIGITSALPGEGKTTVSANLAQLFGASCATLLIDGDTRSPRLSEAVLNSALPDQIMPGRVSPWLEPVHSVFGYAGLHFMGIDSGQVANWHDRAHFDAMLESCAEGYDKVIVDLPPAGAVAEARYIAPLLDAIIVVAEAERTPEDALIACIDACNIEPHKVIGVILNKAHESVLPSSYALERGYIVDVPARPAAQFVTKRSGRN